MTALAARRGHDRRRPALPAPGAADAGAVASPRTSRSSASGSRSRRWSLFVEWLYLRTGDPLYRTLARRWSRVMLALFAVGVVTGTILSFEFGLLWPEFMATFGDVFGLAFALEGFSFFLEAIFIASTSTAGTGSRRAGTSLCGIPSRAHGPRRLGDGDRGQRLDEPPDRLPARGRRGHRRAPVGGAVREHVLLARARAHVPRRLHGRRLPRRRRLRAGAAARALGPATSAPRCDPARPCRARRARADPRRRLGGARRGEHQPVKLAAFEGLGTTTSGRADPRPRLVLRTATSSTASRSRDCSRCSPSTTRTRPCRASTRCRRTSGRR